MCRPRFLAAYGAHDVTAVEIDDGVIDCAYATMAPPSAVEVVRGDCVDVLASTSDRAYDVVVVDVFDEASKLPPRLATRSFADDLARVRAGRG